MYTENRYYTMLEMLRGTENRLDVEMKRPLPDTLVLQKLKREKLRLKDEIEAWERLLGPFLTPVRQPVELRA